MVRRAIMLLSGTTTSLAAENENRDDAEGSCEVMFHMALVGAKPFPEMVPFAETATDPDPWYVIEETIKLNVKPSTDQKSAIGPELNDHGA
jgi:hypothetical protein